MLISWMTSIERYIYLAKHSEPPQSFKIVWSDFSSSEIIIFAILCQPSIAFSVCRTILWTNSCAQSSAGPRSVTFTFSASWKGCSVWPGQKKRGPLSWRPCSHQRKLHYRFQPNFNMFQVSQSICTFSVSGEFGLTETEETLWFIPLDLVPPVSRMQRPKLSTAAW